MNSTFDTNYHAVRLRRKRFELSTIWSVAMWRKATTWVRGGGKYTVQIGLNRIKARIIMGALIR